MGLIKAKYHHPFVVKLIEYAKKIKQPYRRIIILTFGIYGFGGSVYAVFYEKYQWWTVLAIIVWAIPTIIGMVDYIYELKMIKKDNND